MSSLFKSLTHTSATGANPTGAARQALRAVVDIILLAVALYAVFRGSPSRAQQQAEYATRAAVAPYAPMAEDAITVAAVGDGAGANSNDTWVADMIAARQPDLFLYLGDVYEHGSAQDFAAYYGPTYGRLRNVTNPVPGNHEYHTADAASYFSYWENIPSYYSYDSSGWHFVALNSALPAEQLAPGSAQYEWLKADLAASESPCTLVHYHHPRYSIGGNGDNDQMAHVWALLAQAGVDVVLAGNDKGYQRWNPLDANGAQAADGVTAFVVGTGGHGLRDLPGSDARVAAQRESYGALFLDLAPDGLAYRFLDTAGQALDAGTVTCSGAAAPEPAGGSARAPRIGPLAQAAAHKLPAIR
jgi:hypothetical protein